MDYPNGNKINRDIWEFEYRGNDLVTAAEAKRAYHQSRVDWWEKKKQEVFLEIKESGLEINESLAQQYMSNAGRGPQVMIKTELQENMSECHNKIQSHMALVREYDGWAQVLSANKTAIVPLKYGDWLFFFGRN